MINRFLKILVKRHNKWIKGENIMAKKKVIKSVESELTEQEQIAKWLSKNNITKVESNVGGGDNIILKGFAARRNTFKKKTPEATPVKTTKKKK